MAQVNADLTVVSGLLKKVWGNLRDVLPEGYVMLKDVAPFEEKKKAGSSIEVPMILTAENGVSCGDGSQITFADAQAGVIKAASVTPYELFVSSGILTAVLSRAAAEGEQAVKQASKQVIKNNVKSHMRFAEHFALYGQDAKGIGAVNYTAQAETVNGIVLTAGINASSKWIRIAKDSFAPGIFLGSEGMEVEEIITSSGAVADSGSATGKIVAVDLSNRMVQVSFTPIGTSGADTHFLRIKSAGASSSMIGAKNILVNASTLFGLNAATYGLLKGSQVGLASTKLTFSKLIAAISVACDSGLDTDVLCVVSNKTWGNLMTEQAALRNYDSSYKVNEAVNGAEGIVFHGVNGSITIKPSRFVRLGDAFVFEVGAWKRYGSTDITLKLPGMGDDFVVMPSTTNVFTMRSYSDAQIFCDAPARSVYISGIDPDSAT